MKVELYVPVLAAILIFGVIIFFVVRIVKDRTVEHERAEEEEKKATPDPDEFH